MIKKKIIIRWETGVQVYSGSALKHFVDMDVNISQQNKLSYDQENCTGMLSFDDEQSGLQ